MTDNLNILLLAPFGKNGGVTEYSKALSREFERGGLTVIRLSTQVSGKGIVKAIKQPFHIALQLIRRRKEYNIISVQLASDWGFMPGVVAVFIGKMLGRKVISTYHGGGYKRFISRHPHIFKYVISRSEIFLVVSQSMERDIGTKFSKYKDRIKKTSNGYDGEIFRPMGPDKCRKKLEIPKNKTVIHSVGGLYAVKGHRHIIDAMEIVNDVCPQVFCYIVGDGAEYLTLIKQIDDLGLNDVVKLSGARPHNEIPLWMNACDIFVLPSLYEGNPTVMFEALACGRPFVGTPVGGIPEIIINEKLGLLVPPANPQALAEAIIKALKTEWDSEYITNYAKQFSSENVAKRVMEIYSEVQDVDL